MLTTLIVLLFVGWMMGVVTQYTLGGLIHLLFLFAVIGVLVRIIQGRKPIP